MNTLKIKIRTKTWNKDSYGLFDYENDEVNKQTFTIESSCNFYREKDSIKSVYLKSEGSNNENLMSPNLENYLISVFYKEKNSYIFNQIQQKIWMALSSKLSDGKDSINIKEGDFFKLGKIMFEVLKIKNYEEKKKGFYYDSFLNSLKQYYKEDSNELLKKNTFDTQPATLLQEKLIPQDKEYSKKVCRFCLSDTIIQENPLINICKCDGSLKYVHLICLQNWLTNKLHLKKTDGVLTVLWQGLSCELCKTQLPLSIETNGQIYDLIDFKSFDEEDMPAPLNCLLLQSFAKNGKPSGLHFIDIGIKHQIRIGRGNECEIRLSDISVSRFHSLIKFENNKFLLKDNSSKFGTLFLQKKNIPIGDNHLFIQCGRTLLEIYTSRKWFSNFPCLNCESNVNNDRGNGPHLLDNDEEEKK